MRKFNSGFLSYLIRDVRPELDGGLSKPINWFPRCLNVN